MEMNKKFYFIFTIGLTLSISMATVSIIHFNTVGNGSYKVSLSDKKPGFISKYIIKPARDISHSN